MIKRKMGNMARAMAIIFSVCTLFAVQPISALAATGTVTSSNVKVRAEASTASEQVSSLDSGDKVDIIDETTDSQGYVWYRIYVNGNEYGYVRSDLISKSGSVSSSNTQSAESLPQTQVTATESQPATVTVASANVRGGAGTGYDTVGTVKNGDTVTITGEATGTDNKKWYQISFGDSGRTGFVRSDLVQLGAAAPAEETAEGGEVAEGGEAVDGEVVEGAEGAEGGEVAEQPAEETANSGISIDTVGNGEFSLAYKDDGTGTETWYLYDNVEGTQVKLNDLLNYATEGQQTGALKKQAGSLKVALVVMAVIIALMVLAILLLIFKLRDYMYYEDDEPAENSAKKKPQYNDSSKKEDKARTNRVSPERESKGRTVADSRRPASTVTPSRERKSAPMGTADSLNYGGSERKSMQSSRAVDGDPVKNRPAQNSRKPRNFLLEDDDFEFEFLDLDDDEK
ncbi:SH3 domain-containing protein [Butyrivibrio sp. WCD3002]|uniref:SH3 domain-containing protein n=1 Tax=Butyrivibrio sp. WCD3002 TaxID=1280676 RepID=UPI000426F3A5|nr:SH3 domain-containing protein [Butyrivibrio sp. WCD3002]